MVSPQTEDGHVRIANDLFEAICGANLSGGQYAVVLAIIRKTYGWHKKKDAISRQQIADMTGIGSHSYISQIISDLEGRGILLVTRKIGKPTVYAINKDYSQWKLSLTPPQNLTGMDGSCEIELNPSAKPDPSAKTDPSAIEEGSSQQNLTGTPPQNLTHKNHVQPLLENHVPTSDSDAPMCDYCSTPPTATSGIGYVKRRLHDTFRAARGFCPTFKGSDHATLTELLQDHSESDVIATYTAFMDSEEEWVAEKGFSIWAFSVRYDAVHIARQAGKVHGRSYAKTGRHGQDGRTSQASGGKGAEGQGGQRAGNLDQYTAHVRRQAELREADVDV